jgi:hypothetical protein
MSNIIVTIAAALVGVAAAGTFVLTFQARHTINQIHVMVNSKMTDALKEIKDLKEEVAHQKHLPAEDTDA